MIFSSFFCVNWISKYYISVNSSSLDPHKSAHLKIFSFKYLTIDAQYDATMSLSCWVYFRMNKLFEVKWFKNEWNVWLDYYKYRHQEAFPWHEKSYRLASAGGNDNHLIVKTSIITFNLLPLRITCYLKECWFGCFWIQAK